MTVEEEMYLDLIQEFSSTILKPPVHIRIKGKDYIVVQLKNGELKILNRRGKERISVDKY